ncbi:MAG: iron ABC transporter permease [Dehalococcoidia bacterium]|nr:iron ABC transporter permease [Dehalococcoidia bacterium]
MPSDPPRTDGRPGRARSTLPCPNSSSGASGSQRSWPCCVAVAVPAAWLTTRADIPARRVWSVLLTVPSPSFVYHGPGRRRPSSGRRVCSRAGSNPSVSTVSPEVYGFWGAAFTLTCAGYPYVYLVVRAALASADTAEEEASRSLGVSPLRTFFAITLPGLVPALAAGILLSVLYTLSDFGAVSLLNYSTFTRDIFISTSPRSIHQRRRPRCHSQARHASHPHLRTRRALLASTWAQTAAGGGAPRPSAAGSPRTRVSLDRRQPRPRPAGRSAHLLAHQRLAGQRRLPGARPGSSPFGRNGPRRRGHHRRSRVPRRHPLRPLRRAPRQGGRTGRHVTHALPGLVVALALVFFGIRYATGLYQTVWMLLLAYVILFVPNALSALRGTLVRQPANLEDAAASLGKGPLMAIATVTAPLARPGLAAAFALVFLTIMKELPATLILSPPGYQTLPGLVWSRSTDALYAGAALPALALIAVAAIPVGLLAWKGDIGALES